MRRTSTLPPVRAVFPTGLLVLVQEYGIRATVLGMAEGVSRGDTCRDGKGRGWTRTQGGSFTLRMVDLEEFDVVGLGMRGPERKRCGKSEV